MSVAKIGKKTRQFILSTALFVGLLGLPCFVRGQTQTKSQTRRLVVSFTSICCGIDREAKEKLDDFITKYEKTNGKQLATSSVKWGREGEIDYCLKLSELSRKQQKTFISQVRSLIGKSKLVEIRENAECQTGR